MKILKKMLSTLTAVAMCAVFVVNSASPVDVVSAAGVMRDITSQEVVSDMGLGWNLGNTFDSYYTGQQIPASDVERAWGNPNVTKELIEAVKAEGFKSIRLPVTWMNCMDSEGNIEDAFMARVKEVVDYCMDEGLYVILNIHHDGCENGWLREADTNYASASAKYAKVWTQIANEFKDYSDYLIFESMNEVGFNLAGDSTLTGNPTSDDYTILNNLNQLFVDTVRATGSNNELRHLLIAGYNTDIAMTCDRRYEVPSDPADRCIVSVHYYSPPQFCVAPMGASWGYASTWGTAEEQAALDSTLDLVKSRFVDAGTPVIIGEYGVLTEAENGKDQSSIVAYLEAVAEAALERGICPVLWDSGNGGDMKFINRTSLSWNKSAIDAVYDELSGKYSEGVTTPAVTNPSQANSKTVTLSTDEEGNRYIDLSPYIGKLITGVGFTVEGNTFDGTGGVLLGMIIHSDTSSWGGEWKGVNAPFTGSDVGHFIKYSFDADNADSVDPTQIIYNGQRLSFGISWTYPDEYKDSLTIADEVTIYFDGAENAPTTTATTAVTTTITTTTTIATTAKPETTQSTTSEVTTTVTEPVTTTSTIQTTIAVPETTVTTVQTTEAIITTTSNTTVDTTINSELATVYGDINGDGTVNVADVVSINMYLLNPIENAMSDVAMANADCVRDSVINTSDSALIMNFVAMVITQDKLGVL